MDKVLGTIMGDEIKLDKATFEARLSALQAAWKDKKIDAFNGVKSILSVMGKSEEGPYSKSLALHVSMRFSSRSWNKWNFLCSKTLM